MKNIEVGDLVIYFHDDRAAIGTVIAIEDFSFNSVYRPIKVFWTDDMTTTRESKDSFAPISENIWSYA